jgi:addiction module RelE/StbE family toxin
VLQALFFQREHLIMLTPGYKNSFKKDLKLMQKRGKNLQKMYDVMTFLIHEKPLPKKHVDHSLRGNIQTVENVILSQIGCLFICYKTIQLFL